MTPYYEHGGIVIYHGDCREILPQLGRFDLILTDPKYGIDADRDRNCQANGWRDYGSTGWDRERTQGDVFETILRASQNVIIWGGNYFTDFLPPSMGWLAWDKGQRNFSLADFEMAWTSYKCASRCFDYPRALAMQDGKQHPTQKPLALMKWCIAWADERSGFIENVCDPLMGSGTTLRAAKDLGRKAIGIEIEERYCEIAAKRLAQEVLPIN